MCLRSREPEDDPARGVPASCKLSALRLAVEAHPNARVDRLELAETTLRVWVRARAIDGQANVAIERAIAEALGLRPRQVRIVAGTNSRHKTVDVALNDIGEVRARLNHFNKA